MESDHSSGNLFSHLRLPFFKKTWAQITDLPSPFCTLPIASPLLSRPIVPALTNVRGATKGIGRAISLDLATRGASILGTYSSPQSAHLFDTLTHSINDLYSSSPNSSSHTPAPSGPKLVGALADISSPSSSVPAIQEGLQKHFNGKVDIVIFNAAVMGLAKMGDGGVTEDFVDAALAGNVKFPVLLIEMLVKGSMIRRDGRVVAISSEGVRARRPPGG